MDFFKRLVEQLKTQWAKWSRIQKLIAAAIVVVALGLIIGLAVFSGAPSMVAVIDTPITDQTALDRIVTRINQEGVTTTTSAAGLVMVQDETTARRMRSILIAEGLVPQSVSPWDVFNVSAWTITDYERNVQFQQAITRTITQYIKALDGIDNATVVISWPEDSLFTAQQNPITATVTLFPRPGSDIATNIQKIKGVQQIIKYAVSGLSDDNINITDNAGNVLIDFSGMAAANRIELTAQQERLKANLENQYKAQILKALQNIFTADRVKDVNIKIDMDFSQQLINSTEYSGITITPDNPSTSYDDSQVVETLPLSVQSNSTKWTGTGYNPEGPAGTEGQVAPSYQDMSNLTGTVEQSSIIQNNALNQSQITSEKSPTIDRVTVSVNIDGSWKVNYDADRRPVVQPDGSIERTYTPLTDAEISNATSLIQNAIGYSQSRGDAVTVTNIAFDRTAIFAEQDAALARRQQIQTIVIIFLAGLAGLLLVFFAIRMVSRELERRRRQREEQLALQQEQMRQAAILEAENQGMEVSMSVEERRRMELQENAITMAKEHTADVAQLLRTWMLEE
jgi:flagellar M-ring protein FliF